MLTPNKNFQDKICVSCYVYKVKGKKIINNLPKNYKNLKESRLVDTQGQNSIMVLTGKENDLICFDVDDMEWFKEYRSLFEDIYCEESFSGKLHYYFKYTDDISNCRNGFFDILSDKATALTGKPLNDLPILEMTEDIKSFITEQISSMENQNNEILELVKLMDYRYVKSKDNWLAIGQSIKYMNGTFFAWDLVSAKDDSGYAKNFNSDGINSMDGIWDDELLGKTAFNFKLKEAHDVCKLLTNCPITDPVIKQKQIMKTYEFVQGYYDPSDQKFKSSFQIFAASKIAKLAKKFEDDAVINWLVERDYMKSNFSKIPVRKNNHFDEDDKFYWIDFQKKLTERGKEYKNGEVLRIVCENLHRVCAMYDTSAIIKKHDQEMHSLCSLSKFPDFEIDVNFHKDPTISFLKYLKTTTWIIPEVAKKKLNCKFDFSYSNEDTFYAACKFVAKVGTKSGTKLELLLLFLKEIICNNDQIVYEYFIKWLAMLWKFPHIKTEKALLLFGEEGIGKGTLVSFLCENVFGTRNCLPNASYEDITGHKNKNLVGKKLICVNELASGHGKKALCLEKVKTLITEYHFEMNAMCKDLVTVENSFDFIFMTNNQCSLKIKPGDRRFFCIHCSDSKKEDATYFTKLREECFNAEGASEFVSYLETLLDSPEEFRQLKTPMTELKEKMIISSEWDSSFYEALLSGELDSVQYDVKEINGEEFALFNRQELYTVYSNFMKDNGFKPNNSARFKESILKNLASEKNYKHRKYYGILNQKITVIESTLEFDD